MTGRRSACHLASEMVASDTARRPIRIWIAAAIGAVALHTGAAALAIVAVQPDDAPDALGANAIEVDYVRMAPKVDPADLPAGPDADASAASPTTEEQKTVVTDTALPKAKTTDTDDPDRTAVPDKTPAENEPATPSPASSPAVAAEATAMPSSETAVASQRSAAPQPGSGDSLRRLRTTWQKELAAHIDKYKRYPADRANKGAEIVLRFALDRMGHVLAIDIVRSSGDTSFDDAALAMIKRADPLPPPPPQVADEGLTFTMPVDFRARTAHR